MCMIIMLVLRATSGITPRNKYLKKRKSQASRAGGAAAFCVDEGSAID